MMVDRASAVGSPVRGEGAELSTPAQSPRPSAARSPAARRASSDRERRLEKMNERERRDLLMHLQQAMRAKRTVFGQKLGDSKQAFAAFDRDSSGTLSRDEMRKALDRLGFGLSDAQIGRQLELMDTSADGMIDYEELLALLRGAEPSETTQSSLVAEEAAEAPSRRRKSARRRTKASSSARGTAMPVPPDRRSTVARRPSSAGRRTRRPSPAAGSSGRSASARRVSTYFRDEALAAGPVPSWGASGSNAGGPDHRVAAPAWKDTQDEAQLDTLRAALTAISAAESELEEIRRQDEAHLREQQEMDRERRQQAIRLEKAELQIRELAESSGTLECLCPELAT